MSLFKKKDKDESPDLSIIADVKEPFSWSVFWDEQIVGKWRTARKFLEERGILFFLLSPFQYRNRLILKLSIVVLGTLLGVVPRSAQLLRETKTRNAQSELASIVGKQFSADSIRVKPLASGQYERQHLLVFSVDGDEKDGVRSVDDGFDVVLSSLRGVSDAGNVKYRYHVVPVSAGRRLMLVWVDNTQQNDRTGIYNLTISVKNKKPMSTPMEIVLSDGQDETDVFRGGVIDLASLSSEVLDKSTVIENSEKELEEALENFARAEERLRSSDVTLNISSEQLRSLVDGAKTLTDIKDGTTTRQAVSVVYETAGSLTLPELEVTVNGSTYSRTSFDGVDPNSIADANTMTARSELDVLGRALSDVGSKLSALNNAREARYNTLIGLSNALNQEIGLGDMTDAGKIIDAGK